MPGAAGDSSDPGVSMFQYESLRARAYDDFSDLKQWMSANPNRIAEHFERYEKHITEFQKEGRLSRRALRFMTKRATNDEKERDYIDYFGITNLGQLPPEGLRASAHFWRETLERERIPKDVASLDDAIDAFSRVISTDIPEEQLRWLGGRLERLYQILPEFVLQNDGMDKVLRTVMGVMALTAAEAVDAPAAERNDRVARSIAPAYFYAATYPIVDDVLQDSDYVRDANDASRYHSAILHGLTTGEDISPADMPDHPLAEELLTVYNEMRLRLPFDDYRDTYYALESMYRAQHNDATAAISADTTEADVYVPIMIKASLSRIVGHMITGRTLPPERSGRMLQTLLRQQLADDRRDVMEDLRASRQTPFTLPSTHPELPFENPLLYHIAQEAYIGHRAYADEDPDRVNHVLSKVGAYDMAYSLSTSASYAQYMAEHFGDQGGPLDHLIRVAASLGRHAVTSKQLTTPDKHLAAALSQHLSERDPQSMDPRTYISDVLPYVDELLARELPGDSAIEEVMIYALEAGGKRIRPALTLMLAESLGVPRESVNPLLVSSEFAHTASLLFDDLPAQDDAPLRRGQETAHIKFPEYDAQLAGIAMLAHSTGVLGRLGEHFPPDRVNAVVEYAGTILGPHKLCLGQHMDLAADTSSTAESIIEMYNLKTSTLIEHALVPLMMLEGRPAEEIAAMQRYAYHAGIVFQLRDDILDASSSSDVMGKLDRQDGDKQNIVTRCGVEEAQSMLETHVQGATEALEQLPFPTDLLKKLVVYFATRNR